MNKMFKISIALSCCLIFFVAVVSSLSLKKNTCSSQIRKQSSCNYKFLVPNVVGEEYNKAVNNYNLVKVSEEYNEEIPAGNIISQSPVSGVVGDENGTIITVVSKGSKFVELPDVRGKSIGEASIILSNCEFIPKAMVIPSENEEGIVMGYYGISYRKGIKLEKFKEIILEVSG